MGARALAASIVVACAGLTCGGATDIGEGLPRPAPSEDGGDVPAFADGASAAAQPVACTACRLDAECSEHEACVAYATGDGYCAPGCTKEGFCTSDRTCRWVRSMTGAVIRACVPRGGCAH